MRRATCTICRVLAVAAVFLIMFQSGQVEPVSSVGFSPSDAEFDGLQSVYFTPPEERWLGGVDFDGDFFYGGADYAKELFDWGYLDPVADVDSFCSVEVRFSTTTTQKAYRYIRGGADNWGYDGYYEVPFTVWDIDSNRQLNAAFVEWVDSDVFDSTWGPSADPDLLGGREYLFVMNTDYSGEDYTNATIPYWTYNLLTDELLFDMLYALWPKLELGHTLSELADGQKLVFSDRDATARVVGKSPTPCDLSCARNAQITVAFNNPMDTASFNDTTLAVHGSVSGWFGGAFEYDSSSHTVTRTPDREFKAGEKITVLVDRSVKTDEGLGMDQNVIWTFTAATQTPGVDFVYDAAYQTGFAPYALELCDFDGDGLTDIAAACQGTDSIAVLLNYGNGTFAPSTYYASGDSLTSIVAGDFDLDGDPDLAVTNYTDSSVSVFANQGNGTFGLPVAYTVGENPTGVVSTDIDGDNDLDLITSGWNGSETVSLMQNEGDGTFVPHWYQRGYGLDPAAGLSAADFDGDGDMDLAVGLIKPGVFVLLNWGDGYFADTTTYSSAFYPLSIVAGDFDGDGDEDFVTSNWQIDSVLVYLNDGSGAFAPYSHFYVGTVPINLDAGDLDGDGDLDLAVACMMDQSLTILWNNGAGAFGPPVPNVVNDATDFVAVADLDNDLDLDLIAGCHQDSVRVVLNKFGTAVEPGQDQLPNSFALSQNYPNPFNPATKIEYEIESRCHVVLTVYDVLGRRVKVLVDEERPAGTHEVKWDGRNEAEQPAATGVYIYEIRAGERNQSRKMLLLK